MHDGALAASQARIRRAPTRQRKALVADLFCGAGGTDRGAKSAFERLGLRMELVAVNHDEWAIASHKANFPEARQYIADVNAAKPWLLVPEGRLDLLLASPECTHHSRARGGKPTSDQKRMDPWAIVTWVSQLRVKRFLIENVPEYVQWGPVDPRTGKPIKSRKGEYFRAWIAALQAHGFVVEYKILNCADYGDATTRQRLFVIGRSDGKRIRWPQPTHASASKAAMLGLKPWRPARDIIDWSIQGRSIFNRKKPLAQATLARIEAGARKFKWPEPFLVILRRHMDGKSIDEPIPAACTAGHIGLAQPFVLSPSSNGSPRGIDEPVPTITTGGAANEDHPGCPRHAIVEPFILSRHAEGAPRSIDEPTPTQVAKHSHLLVEPMIAPYYGDGSGRTCKGVDEPLDTVTSLPRFGLVMPVAHGSDPSNRARELEDPLPTITTAKRGELALITAAFGEREGQAPRVHSVDDPVPTICAKGRINLVQARGYDILFRMLEPHELAAAMSLAGHRFVGSKRQQTRQIGNAVPAETAAALVGALMEA